MLQYSCDTVTMQSYLQYRNFGQQLKRQLQQNKLKPRAFIVPQDDSSSHSSLPEENGPPLTDAEIEKDLENGNPRVGDDPSPMIHSDLATHEQFQPANYENDPRALYNVDTHRTTDTQLGISLTGIDVRTRTTLEG